MPMMKCGHVANANSNGKPCCVICAGVLPEAFIVNENPPSLEGRIAKCAYGCGNERPSIESLQGRLAFFEYCGEDSTESKHCKVCGFGPTAHLRRSKNLDNHPAYHDKLYKCIREGTYEPKGDRGYDRYYCGCRGWD